MGRILRLEHGRDSAAQLLAHLHGAGHHVEQAGDGAAALARILKAPLAHDWIRSVYRVGFSFADRPAG